MTAQTQQLEDWYRQLDIGDIRADVRNTYGQALHKLNLVDPDKHARDVLNPQKVADKLEVLQRFSGDLRGATLLEIGSGYGMFIAVTRLRYGIYSFGVEPSGPGYESSLALSRKLLRRCGLDPKIIVEGCGEQLPLRDGSFDVVYSTHVLEHVQDPALVLREAARVLRPGGIAQMVVPNYGSFWDGHYGMFWPPYVSHALARRIVQLAGRDPAFVDTLQLITQRQLRSIMRGMADQAEVLDWGAELFHQRLTGGGFRDWAALGRVKRVVQIVRALGIAHAASFVLRHADAITPIVLTFRRR